MEDTTSDDEGAFTKEDTALFGSLNKKIADEFKRSLDAALEKGVASLPLIGTNSEKLMKRIHKTYWRNVDLFELYCGRNVFSVAMYAPSRRAAIVGLYLDDKADLTVKKAPLGELSSDIDNKQGDDFPTPDQIPSPADLQKLEQQTVELRERVAKLQRRRSTLEKQLSELDVAAKLVGMADTSVQSASNVPETVQATVVATESLRDLQNKGKDLAEKMDEQKRQRDPNADEIVYPVAAKIPKKTLEERYEQDSSVATSSSSLAAVKDMIFQQ